MYILSISLEFRPIRLPVSSANQVLYRGCQPRIRSKVLPVNDTFVSERPPGQYYIPVVSVDSHFRSGYSVAQPPMARLPGSLRTRS